MEVTYPDEKLTLTWEHKITKSTIDTKINTTTQCVIGFNNIFINLFKIRKVMFIYKHPLANKYGITTTEPPLDEYFTVLTRTNGTQVTISVPKELGLKLDTVQYAKIVCYPHEEDPILKTKPYITLEIIDVEETDSTAEVIKTKEETKLKWIIDSNKEVPSDLEQFLTEDEIKQLNHNPEINIVEVNLQTLKTTIHNENEKD